MKTRNTYLFAALFSFSVIGCQHLPEDRAHRGAAIGGAAGAAAGAIFADDAVTGAILGGLLGAGGGYVIGAETRRVQSGDEDAARAAAERAENRPVTPEEARRAETADINQDGFVTLDEVVAMNEAGLTDQEMIRRLEATGQVFELAPEQERFLFNRGISSNVVNAMSTMNRHLLEEQETRPDDDVIGRPQGSPPRR